MELPVHTRLCYASPAEARADIASRLPASAQLQLVDVRAHLSASLTLTQLAEVEVRVEWPAADGDGSKRRLALVLAGSQDEYVYWGLLPYAQLDASESLTRLHRDSFVASPPLPRVTSYDDDENGGLCLDELRNGVLARLRAYERGGELRPQLRRVEAGVHRFLLLAVASLAHLDYDAAALDGLHALFLEGERRVERYQLGWYDQARPAMRVRWEEAPPRMLRLVRTNKARLRGGWLRAAAVCWTPFFLDRLGALLLRRLAEARSAGVHLFRDAPKEQRELFIALRRRVRRTLTPERMQTAAKRQSSSSSKTEAVVVAPLADIEDLGRCLPACMHELAMEAFHPDVRRHLKHQDRDIFYRFALANGVDAEELRLRAREKFTHWQPEPNYDMRSRIDQAIKSKAAYVAKQRANGGVYNGDSCTKLQRLTNKNGESYCPFFRAPNRDERQARCDCHTAMEAVIGRRDEPGTKWPQGLPLAVAQHIRSRRVPANSQPHPSLQQQQQASMSATASVAQSLNIWAHLASATQRS